MKSSIGMASERIGRGLIVCSERDRSSISAHHTCSFPAPSHVAFWVSILKPSALFHGFCGATLRPIRDLGSGPGAVGPMGRGQGQRPAPPPSQLPRPLQRLGSICVDIGIHVGIYLDTRYRTEVWKSLFGVSKPDSLPGSLLSVASKPWLSLESLPSTQHSLVPAVGRPGGPAGS